MKKIIVLLWCFLSFVPMASSQVVITDVLCDPVGSDTGKEFVRLQNVGTGSVLLSSYIIDADLLPLFTPSSGSLLPGESITILFRTDTLIGNEPSLVTGSSFGSSNMRNSDGEVALYFKPNQGPPQLIDYLMYGNISSSLSSLATTLGVWNGVHYSCVEGVALHKPIHDGTLYPQPTSGNILEEDRSGSSSGSTLPEIQILTGSGSTQVERGITENIVDIHNFGALRFSEIFPNAEGSDTGQEWIEIINPTDDDMVVEGLEFLLLGTSSVFRLQTPVHIGAQGYFVVDMLTFTLPNTRGTLQMRIGSQIIDEIFYENPPEGKSYSYIIK